MPLEGQHLATGLIASYYLSSENDGRFAFGPWNNNGEPIPLGRYRLHAACGDHTPTNWYNLPTVIEVVVTPPGVNDPRNVPEGLPHDSEWWEWPDGDGDGLPDHWEQNGVWVGNTRVDLAAAGATVSRKDLFIYVDHEEGQPLDSAVYRHIEQSFDASPLDVAVHFLEGRAVPSAAAMQLAWTNNNGTYKAVAEPVYDPVATASGSISSPWFGGGAVPQLAKYFVNLEYRETSDRVIGTADVGGPNAAGRAGWVAYNVAPLWLQNLGNITPNPRAIHFSQAANLMHEIGHTLGLHHFGAHSCANWREGVESGDQCQDGSTLYRSVMSYAYNTHGIPSSPPGGPNRIDYSTETNPHYDWTMGSQAGQLRFIPGQYGELSTANYSAQGLFGDVPAGEVEVTSFDDMTRAMTPSGFDSFARTVGVQGRPEFPEFVSPVTTYSTTIGSSVTARIEIQDTSGQPVTWSVEDGPGHGTFSTEGTQFTYTPPAGFTGQEKVIVRAGNGTLSTDPLVLTFNVTQSTTPTTPTLPPNTGSSSDWGSS
ncbi:MULTISPECIES: Ig-like domain-containing protein [Actinomycetes]|uniref:Ig-like domain-containing protein n=1 Tax=Actinomycetes TaxID=1760 RepID=UPI0012DF5F59|nr:MULTISPECIES: Ig-like domain-containing protein [Actinomycetes]